MTRLLDRPAQPYQTIVLAEGIVITRVLPNLVQDVEYARENLARAIATRGGVRRPVLIDARGAPAIKPEARHVYLSEALATAFSAFAMVVDANPVGLLEAKARVWLRRYVP